MVFQIGILTNPNPIIRDLRVLMKLKSCCLCFRFWGWGGEDDDFFKRVKTEKLSIFRESQEIGRFKVSITH